MFPKETQFFYLAILTFFTVGCVNKKAEMNLVKSEAFQLAYESIKAEYPEVPKQIEEWDIYFEEGKWYVYPKLGDDEVGGGPTAEINDHTGKVIRVYFSE